MQIYTVHIVCACLLSSPESHLNENSLFQHQAQCLAHSECWTMTGVHEWLSLFPPLGCIFHETVKPRNPAHCWSHPAGPAVQRLGSWWWWELLSVPCGPFQGLKAPDFLRGPHMCLNRDGVRPAWVPCDLLSLPFSFSPDFPNPFDGWVPQFQEGRNMLSSCFHMWAHMPSRFLIGFPKCHQDQGPWIQVPVPCDPGPCPMSLLLVTSWPFLVLIPEI